MKSLARDLKQIGGASADVNVSGDDDDDYDEEESIEIEESIEVVVEDEEFFAQAALGFKGIVIRGFGSFCGRCCRDFVFVFFSVIFVIFLDFFFGDDGKARRRRVFSSSGETDAAASRRTFFRLNFERSEEASLFGDADEHIIRNAN